MSSIIYSPLYVIADALQMRIASPLGKIKAHKFLQVAVGPWTIDIDVNVMGDYSNSEAAGAFVKLRGQLWGYIMATSGNHPKKHLDFVLFDYSKVPVQSRVEFGLVANVDPQFTLKIIDPAVVAAHEFIDNEWKPCEFTDLVARHSPQRPQDAGKRHQDRSRSATANK